MLKLVVYHVSVNNFFLSKKSLKRSSKGDPFGIIGVWSLDISFTVVDVVIFTTAGLTKP